MPSWLAGRTELRVVVASATSAGGLKNALPPPLLLGFRASWTAAIVALRHDQLRQPICCETP
jgi:hypothetical protein